jgi:solute carrier family 39 (zinc transporter), member 7
MEYLYTSLTSSRASAAFLSTAAISVAPNVLLLLFPNIENQEPAGAAGTSAFGWLSLGQAMAAGGLLGDVFLHTVAESEGDPKAGLWILGGFTIFYTVDLLVRMLQGVAGGHDHHYDHHHHQNGAVPPSSTGRKQQQELHRSMIILNVAADALHNFTDGLAIGATYAAAGGGPATVAAVLSGHTRGWITTVSIMCHEIPHEIGDYCTLIRSGYTRSQAIMMQLWTATAAFCGTATAMYTQAWLENELLWITAGGFIYLAASTLLPEVLQDTTGPGSSSSRAVMFRLAQLVAFIIGIGFLYAVSLLEDYESHGSGDHHHHHHGHHAHHNNKDHTEL